MPCGDIFLYMNCNIQLMHFLYGGGVLSRRQPLCGGAILHNEVGVFGSMLTVQLLMLGNGGPEPLRQ